MGLQVEEFRLPLGRTASEEACRRALRSPGWQEHSTDLLEFEVSVPGSSSLIVEAALVALYVMPFTRRVFRRATTLSARAPVGPADNDGEILAVWERRLIARISLRERGTLGTDVTISGATLGARTDDGARSAIPELRRSIEIQSGSLTPYRSPTA